jgi:hypothetical protein
LQHFPGDLRIARLIGANQPDDLHAEEKKEPTECDERDNVGGTAGAFLQDAVLFQCVIRSLRNRYCTATW